jgi:cation diffusion facilitator CzcD-associated flavoprotein CzcO
VTSGAHPDGHRTRGQGPRVAVIGTGFAGLGVAFALERLGVRYTVFERGEELGGTWRDNSYPGCQCDVPSHLYSFSFAPNPDWSRTYSMQEEIWEYLRRCAEEFGVRPRIKFATGVEEARWDEQGRVWRLKTSDGPHEADVLISGNGALAEPYLPDLPGLDTFTGAAFHTARWDHGLDLRGRRVAVVGTGASAIQVVPKIQPLVERMHVFQRTPAWVLPHTDRRIREWERAVYRRFPAAQRLVRHAIYWSRELLVVGMAKDTRFTRPLERIARAHLRRQVHDPDLRRKLTPTFLPGCKRLLLSNDFYPALTRPNVELVTDPIREVTPSGIITADGRAMEFDTIIFGTGFRVTDNPVAQRVLGRGGRSLAEAWAEGGPQAYLGTTLAGFPNLFLMTGPNTGIGHTSVLLMIEAQMNYVADAIGYMAANGVGAAEVRREVQDAYNREIEAGTRHTVWTAGGCDSWYLDAAGRNRTLWPDFTWRFGRRTRRFDPASYRMEGPAERPIPADRPPAAVR